MNRLAFTTLACPEWSLEEAIEAAGRYGYEGIELRLLDGETLPPDLPQEQVRRVRAEMKAANLSLVCVDTSLRISKRSEQIVDDGRAYLAMAAQWEAPFIRVFGGDPAVGLGEQGSQIAIEQLAALARAAREFGVVVLVETHDVFAGSEPLARVLEQVGSANAGILWDTLHPWRVGEEPRATLDRLGKWLHLVHIKDGIRLANGQAELRMLGEGDVPMADVLELLRQHGYDGWLSVEWERKWHPELAPAREALARHAESLRVLLGERSA